MPWLLSLSYLQLALCITVIGLFVGLIWLVIYSLLNMASLGEDKMDRELAMLAASKNGQTKNGGDHPCTL